MNRLNVETLHYMIKSFLELGIHLYMSKSFITKSYRDSVNSIGRYYQKQVIHNTQRKSQNKINHFVQNSIHLT